jgi:uncharacterized protein (DUF2249 family)
VQKFPDWLIEILQAEFRSDFRWTKKRAQPRTFRTNIRDGSPFDSKTELADRKDR